VIADERTVRWDLPSAPSSAGAARRNVKAAAAKWVAPEDSEELVDALALIASELVTNAVRYGQGDNVGLLLQALDDAVPHRWFEVSVEDRDQGRERPHLITADSQAEGGRGLELVANLSQRRWGVRSVEVGKRVWAQVGTEAPASSCPGADPTVSAFGAMRASSCSAGVRLLKVQSSAAPPRLLASA
jgi:anti-sigma regulatory factor (Ser/Thr protein kinase)